MPKEKQNKSVFVNIIVTFFQSVLYGVLFLAYILFLIITFPYRIIKKAFTKDKNEKNSTKNVIKNEARNKGVIVEKTKAEKREFAALLKEKRKDLKRQRENIKKILKQRKKEKARLKAERKRERLELLKAKKEDLKRQKANREQIILARKKAQEKLEQIEKDEKKKRQNAEKEQEKIDKEEEEKRKKRKLEAFANDKYDVAAKEKEAKRNPFLAIIAFPKNLVNWVKNKYKNSLLYKNAQAKKDKQHQIMTINFDGADAIKSEQKQIFEYVAKSPEGKVVKDHFAAYSIVEVHSFLLSEGYEVYSIKTSKMINILYKSANTTKFRNKDLIFFLTQLSTYVKAGIPLVEALKILARQFKQKKYNRIFRSLIYNLTIGDNFSTAMEKQNGAFPNLLINMIKASEMTGELPEALDDMAEYYTQAEKTRKQMITALTYPTIVLVFAIAVITFILLYVVPKFVDIYNSLDPDSIPGFTLFVMNLSYFLQNNFIFVFLIIVAIIVFLVFLYKKVKGARLAMQWIIMHIPVIKDVIIYNEVTMFTKTFSSLLAHNVFITDTLEILGKITSNEIYKLLVKQTAANLERGEKISTAFKDQWCFPIPAYEMIVTGERTGQLSEMMSKVSTYYQELHANTVGRIKAFIEPILIVGLTVIVGFIVLAIVIPMFNLYNQVI